MQKQNLSNKLKDSGPYALTDMELLTMLLGDQKAAYSISQHTGGSFRKMAGLYSTEIEALPCMTTFKAMKILAALEFARRKNLEEVDLRKSLVSSADVAKICISTIGHYSHEVFLVLYLNQSNRLIKSVRISEGGITGTVADVRMILRHALELKACAMVLSHNHPSGNLKPSVNDEQITFKIKEAAKLMDIKVIDHVIVSETDYLSFADEGKI